MLTVSFICLEGSVLQEIWIDTHTDSTIRMHPSVLYNYTASSRKIQTFSASDMFSMSRTAGLALANEWTGGTN